MDDVKVRLTGAVAARLNAAPASREKEELLEELSDNLYRRFLDMAGAGVPEEEAFTRAMDDLGDVDELLSYLGVEPAGQNADWVIDKQPGQTRITSKDGERIIINTGDPAADEERARADEERARADEERARADEERARADARGVHIPQGDLDAIMAGVQEACNVAIDQAKAAIKQAKEALQRRTTVERDSGRVKVHFNTSPEGTPPPAPPVPPAPPAPPSGWEFEAELDSDAGRFFAGAGPKEKQDVVYGFGYDKDRGGFFAQWGEYQGGGQEGRGPHFTGEDSIMEHKGDGSYSVTALKDLRGIEVFTTAGDVSIHVSESADAGVVIDGDVDELDVTCSADGVLTIREGRTASSSFFSRRGFCSADVELYLPRRHWEMISVSTSSGAVDIDRGELDVGRLSVHTMSGDLDARLQACGELNFKSASGDIELKGGCARLRAETMSGDITLRGEVEDAALKSASGDIELEGLASQFRASSVSGDVRVEVSQMPRLMDLSSKSGDCEARIPDAGPFSLHMKTVSGELSCEFPVDYVDGLHVYGDGSGPRYSMTTVSGDVSLERR